MESKKAIRICLECKKEIPMYDEDVMHLINREKKDFYLCGSCVDKIRKDIIKIKDIPILKFMKPDMQKKLELVLQLF